MDFLERITTISCFEEQLAKVRQQSTPIDAEANSGFFHHLAAELFVLDRVVSRLANSNANTAEECEKLDEILLSKIKNLRNACALGAPIQNAIASTKNFTLASETHEFNTWKAIEILLRTEANAESNISLESGLSSVSPATRKMSWQFLANLTVQNVITQQQIWQEFKELLFSYLNSASVENARECTMILYNIFIGGSADESAKDVFGLLANCLSGSHSDDNDFFHIFMEHFLTSNRRVVPLFATCSSPERLAVLYYLADYMRGSDHAEATVHTALLQHICKEFKKKSDCVLKTVSSYVDRIEPKEVVAMLDVIAQASSDERYSHVLAEDGSLFLNVGCLLQSIHQMGLRKDQDANIFSPVQKLDQLAPNSTQDSGIERDISYQLKSMLVRIIGNLAYKNKKNQDLAREMDIILAVLDSTSLDARNPLIKEWSILAVRNLCENNSENQQIIRQLTKVGDAENSPILKELNLDMGSLRINPN